jgi:PAS domain S-box-containing protein
MPDNKKEYAELQKKIKSLRRRVAELEKDELRHSRMGAPPKSDLLYQTLMENIHLGISFIDTNHRVVTTNVGMGRFFRKPRNKIIGKYCFKEFEKRNAICPHCPGVRAMATGHPAEAETEGVRDDGSRASVHIRAFPILEADGSAKGFLEIAEDITKHKRAEKALRDSEEFYGTLVENIGLGINLIDTNYRIIMTNAAQTHLMKKPRSKFLGNYCFKEFEKRDTVCPHCPGKKAMATGRPAEVRTEGIGDDGSHSPVRLQAFPVFEADGSIKGFIEVVEDISERKQAEEKLKESEQRFKTFFDNAADGILLADTENKKFYIGNKAICQMLGYKPEEINNLGVSDIHPKEHLSYVTEQFEKQARREITMAEDLPVKRKNGSVFYADISSFPITLGGKTYLMGIFRDVTDRKQTEEKLQESENKYRTLLENLPQKIFLKDRNSVYVSCNANYASDLNINPDEIAGKTDYEFYPKELAEKYRADDKRIIESEKTEDIEEKYIKDGQELFVHTVKTPVRDERDNAIGLLGIFWDITEHKKIEEELNTYREKMAQAERLASLGTLSATLAHELTQPLTVIRLSIENSLGDLEPTSCDKTVKDALKEALNEVVNATSVVDRFRNFARQSSRKTPCETDLGAIAGRIIKLLGKTAQRAKITLNLKGMDKLPPVYSNEKDLEQLFFALTENAIQAADGKKNHRLTIEGVVKNKNIELRFADNCSGIAPENLNKIFDPFFTTGSDDGRTGLGLPIVQRILSEYGGKISVRSRLGKGTTFYVTLPSCPPKR